MTRYRMRFEPIDIEADSPEEAMDKFDNGDYGTPDIRKVYPIDEWGFPIAD